MRPRPSPFFRHVCVVVCLFCGFNSSAQNPLESGSALLRNSGESLRLPYDCNKDDLEWAGMSCSEEEPCPIYLEIGAIASAGRKVFLSGDVHSTAATLTSVLLTTGDAGATWKEPAARIRGAALDQLQFVDAEHGWAAGETQYPLPRDPFFLVTTDGGETWRQRSITEEGGPGSILRFSFDSPQHGELVIDGGKSSPGGRYLMYESQTGGESWNIQSKLDQLPKARAGASLSGDANWRFRPSKDGSSWDIESRSGAQWSRVASFAIQMATCGVTPAR